MKIWIVIAAFNEEKIIGKVIDNLKSHDYENIVVVDDGSGDKTFNVLKSKKIHALSHCINRGQGASLQTGISYALNQGADVIVTFDADGQHFAKEIKDVVAPIKQGYDVVLGSRFLDRKTNIPFSRKLVLKGGALLCRLFYGIRLTDTHNGFRALSKNAAQKIKITEDRMEHGSQIIDEIAKHNLKYKEVPVTIKYSEYSLNKGQSTFNSIRILFKMVVNKFLR